jgi:serine/threonine protein kinase/tetratricopeptide (TPR) repeat protein
MEVTICRKCGGELDPDGTCPICMLAAAFDAELNPVTGTGGSSIQSSVEMEVSEALEHDSFGPYRILRVLGEGGMGAVYLAEQTHPLHRLVALKVVKVGLSSSQILSRFNYERQALALMDHPNIAHVYDAGASEKGRPYFVMEYVDGLPITQYCDQRRLNTKERLELFVPVCQALHHAHQKGVIHRDIKPSNVLVTQVDGQAAPKVIDFGIARATEQEVAEKADFTQLGQFIGTPEYMSPEQADLMTGGIDTSSDVYSLGVLLYELLIGSVPFDAEMLRKAGPVELLRIIREEEAIPMTAKLTRMGKTAHEVAVRRRTDPITLRRLVRGDLNWIVTRAMEKDRQRRYPAASELAADIRRHLDDQPVLASPPSPMYRTRKFVRRHKLPVFAAAAVLVVLVAGIVATTWQAAVARRERAEAVAARTLAEARLNDVHALADSMLFEINDDVKDLSGGTRAREALVRIGEQYLNKETTVTQTDPQRRQELAQAFLAVGDLEGGPDESNLRDVAGARQSYSRSVAILDEAVVSRPQDRQVRHLLTIAYVRQAQLEESALAAKAFGSAIYTFSSSWQQLDESEWPAKTILERAAKSADIYAAQWPADPQGLRDRAEVLQAKREFAPAVKLRQRILAASPNNPVLRWELANAQLALGSSLVLKNRAQSLNWLQKAADACEALSKEEPADAQYQRSRAVALGSMTRVLLNLGRLGEAVESARQAVSILEQLTAADPRNASFRLDLSAARVALSNAYYDKGKTEEALENVALAAAVQEDQAARHPDNPDFPRQAAFQYRNAGRFKSYSMDFKGALDEYRKAEAIDRRLVDRYPSRFEFSEALREDLDSAGGAFLSLGDTPSALRLYRDAFAVAKAATPPQPSAESLVGLALTHQSLAAALKAMSRWDEAIAEQRAAVAIWDRRVAGQPENQSLQRALSRSLEELAKLYEGQGNYQAAVTSAEKARPFLEADYKAHPDDESAMNELRNAISCLRVEYIRAAKYDRAVAAAQQIVEMMSQTGVISRSTANRDLGETLLLAGRRDEGLATFRRAASILDENPFKGHVYTLDKEPSPYFRNALALTLLSIATDFTAARREEESVVMFQRLRVVLEAMVRDNPGDNLYRDTLLRTYRAGALAFLGLGDLRESLDYEQKGLKLERSPASPSESFERALRLARAGSLQFRLGYHDAAPGSWREAIYGFKQAARDGEQQWSANKQNLNAQETIRLANFWGSLVPEDVGGDPSAPGLDGGNAASADRWRNRADAMDTFASPIPLRLQATRKAVALSRQLVGANASTADRLRLAQSLRSEGDAFRAAARCSKGAESISGYHHSRDSYVEALKILTSLKQSGQLPIAGKAGLITVTNNLADAEERLRE